MINSRLDSAEMVGCCQWGPGAEAGAAAELSALRVHRRQLLPSLTAPSFPGHPAHGIGSANQPGAAKAVGQLASQALLCTAVPHCTHITPRAAQPQLGCNPAAIEHLRDPLSLGDGE